MLFATVEIGSVKGRSALSIVWLLFSSQQVTWVLLKVDLLYL